MQQTIPTVYVCGEANSGKASLIRACLDNMSPQSTQSSSAVVRYESPIVIFEESRQYGALMISQEKDAQAVWFCIDGSQPDISQDAITGIKALGSRALVIVTKSDCLNEEQAKTINDNLLKHFLREQIILVSSKEKSGLPLLIEKTKTVIRDTAKTLGCGFLSYNFERKWDEFFSARLKLWNQKNEEEANSYITWAAGRAAAIAIVPLPLADVTPLVANEIYMIYKLAGVYGIANDQSLISIILGATGGSLVGKIGASFLPFLKIPIAAAVTYGVGKAAKAFFESGMELNSDTLLDIFEKAKDEASDIFW